ncbi:MAG: MG2 domain-containing protein [Chloroflexi bacterium]|nr:MG2 domain-containing protein [Chloroflexota bacterium]
MKRRSLAVFFLISVLMLLAIPQLFAQIFPSEFDRLHDTGCDYSVGPALAKIYDATGLENASDSDHAEQETASEEIFSITGLNVPGFMGFYNACSPTTTVHVYHGADAHEELSLYQVAIKDFTANLFARNLIPANLYSEWSWDPVNNIQPKADQLIKRFHIDGGATKDTIPFAFYYGHGLRAREGILKQTALKLTDASGDKLQPGIYFLQFSTADFEHSYSEKQKYFRTKYFLNVATAALTVKHSGGQALVWAVDVNSGKALAHERIDIYGADAALLASGLTDENGILRLDVSAASGKLLAVLKTEEHFALGYTDWDTEIRPQGHRYFWHPPHIQTHVYSDRQVYLRGQRVYIRGVARVKDDMRYSLPDFKTVILNISGPGNAADQAQELELNESGSFHGVFDIDVRANLGPYDIHILRPADDENDDPHYIGGAYPAFTVAKHSSQSNAPEIEIESRVAGPSHDPGRSVDDQDLAELDPIRLMGEKTQFKVGERAKFKITSPFASEAQALITVERAGIISHELITMRSKSLTYEIEIGPEHVPHVYVSAFIVKARSAAGRHPFADYRMGFAELRVEPERETLNIDIRSAGQPVSSPGKTIFELRVTDYKGDPVEAEVSVALVDRATLSPQFGISASLLEAFYGRQRLSVSTSSSLVISAESQPGDLIFPACCGPSGSVFPDFDVLKLPDTVVETAYWNPTLRTNARGEASFELSVPESLANWNLDVRAITDSADGSLRIGEKTFELPIDLMA